MPARLPVSLAKWLLCVVITLAFNFFAQQPRPHARFDRECRLLLLAVQFWRYLHNACWDGFVSYKKRPMVGLRSHALFLSCQRTPKYHSCDKNAGSLKQNAMIISRGWELVDKDFPTARKVNKTPCSPKFTFICLRVESKEEIVQSSLRKKKP